MSFEGERGGLVEQLKSRGYLKTPRVVEAFLTVPREAFIPREVRGEAYADHPLPIGFEQTISAPHMVAIMTEKLEVEPDSNILEVGAGSGYQAAILAELAGEGKVTSIERVSELAAHAGRVLADLGYDNAEVVAGDGTLGFPGGAPYDRIIVTAAAPRIPAALVEQLADGGILLAPVGGRMMQDLKLLNKAKGKIIEESHGGCVFVPLIGDDGW